MWALFLIAKNSPIGLKRLEFSDLFFASTDDRFFVQKTPVALHQGMPSPASTCQIPAMMFQRKEQMRLALFAHLFELVYVVGDLRHETV